jgi:hypothetical protein
VGEYLCVFEAIPAHGEATVLVKVKDYGGGASPNRAVIGSASPDGDPADNVAAAKAKKPVRHYPACGSSIAVAARC